MRTKEKIIQYVQENNIATAKELYDYLNISQRAVFKHLAELIDKKELTKIGKPPKVYYKIPEYEKSNTLTLNDAEETKEIKLINKEFLYITPLGEYLPGFPGFVKWCEYRNLKLDKQIDQYYKMITSINALKKNGLVDGTEKFRSTFEKTYLNKALYIDFYSLPQFGKTKLGQLLLYAKQSQDKERIKSITLSIKEKIELAIEKYNIEAVGFVPPTLKREVQFMRELEKNSNIKLPIIKIVKVRTLFIVPQKTLSKLEDRILNASNTLIVDEKRKFDSVLIIDDAVGSGATFNEVAKQIKKRGIAKKVYGLAVVGSFKGFDVISEV